MVLKERLFEREAFSSSAGDFTLRYFTEVDLDQIQEIEQRSHAHPWLYTHFKSSLDPHHCIGLEFNNELIGYAVLSFVVGEAELLLFVLDKNWQGRGVASAFLKHVVKLSFSRVQSMFLEVRQSNQPALFLYEAVGFNEIGVRANYYPKGKNGREDALVLALERFL